MPNRSIKDERDRPKVGPADPATVRRELGKRLNEREPAIYGKGAKPAKPAENPTRDLSAVGAAKKLKGAKSLRDRQIEEAEG